MATGSDQNRDRARSMVQQLQSNIQAAIFGQSELIEEAMCCLLAGGHIIMTGAPGLAKTTLVRVFAKNLGFKFGRAQFTPDLLPSDIIGSEVLHVDQESGRRYFEFAPGPVFVNLLLADEINRASPRTQSALLEAMQERTVTVAGKTYPLPRPFMVFATQNPFESEGTFPLPEAQLDRFLLHSLVSYPEKDAEYSILSEHAQHRLIGEALNEPGEVQKEGALTQADIEEVTRAARSIPVADEIIAGIRDFVRSSRPEDELCPPELKKLIWYGAGPRAGICLVSASRSLALIQGSDAVRWQHIRRLAKPVMRHRMRLTNAARREALSEDAVIDQLLKHLEERISYFAKGA